MFIDEEAQKLLDQYKDVFENNHRLASIKARLTAVSMQTVTGADAEFLVTQCKNELKKSSVKTTAEVEGTTKREVETSTKEETVQDRLAAARERLKQKKANTE